MMALKIGAPKDYMQLLEEHADIVNLPRVGVDENVAFPAVQANIAPAVAFDDALGIKICYSISYKSLTLFQTTVSKIPWVFLGKVTLMKVTMKRD
jgi:hypothetical protein